MINMFRKSVGRPPVLIIQFTTEYIIELTLLHLCLCYSDLKEIIFELLMMQMNRQWMNTARRSPEYIAGMQDFLEVAKANKNPKGFMCCPCSVCRNDKDNSDWETLHLHLIKNRLMANYVLWTRHGERGVVMEDNEDEEDDNNIPDWAGGQDFADTLMEDADEEEIPEDGHVDDLGQVLKDAQRDCENDNEKAKL
jgi:hypothetical protein